MRKYTAISILLLLAACSNFTLAPADKPQKVAFYTVTPDATWNRASPTAGNQEIWTIDGPLLESLQFFSGIKDGKPLLPPAAGAKKKHPVFRKAMTASEVQELTVDTMAQTGFADVRSTSLVPASFGELQGFRFAMDMTTGEGLDFQGLALGTVKDDRLYLIVYTGASQHYFAAHEEKVERIFASIRTNM